MERVVRARTPYRASVTRMCNEIDTELRKPERNRENLELLKDKLHDVDKALQHYDAKLMELLLDTGAEDATIQTEHDGATDYKDKIRVYKYRLSNALVIINGNSNGSDISTEVQSKKYKLPKIELQKFSGDLRSWLGWWSQFKRIHEDEELHRSDKFHYLVQATEANSEPREIVTSYPPTSDNYEAAVAALMERYGRENLQLQFYIRELLSLVIKNATSTQKLPIQSLYTKVDSFIRSLNMLNLSKEHPSTYFYPLVESCLSEDMLRAWRRHPTSTATGGQGEGNLEKLMEFLKTEVRNEQQISMAKTGFANPLEVIEEDKNENKSRMDRKRAYEKISTKEKTPTAAGLFHGKVGNCLFCMKNHASHDCGNVGNLSVEQRKAKVKEKNACFVCLKPGHRSKACKAFVKCHVCTKRHYTLMCPGVEKMPEVATTTVASANQSCRQDVLLKTLVVWAQGPIGKVKVRLVSDEGSQTSHVGTEVVKRIGSPIVGSATTRNVLFGGQITAPFKENLRKVEILSLDGHVSRNWTLRERSVICPGIPKIPKGPWIQALLNQQVKLLDTEDADVDMPEVEILIGQDLLNEMIMERRIRLTERLAAVRTIFGWCLCGPLGAQEPKSSVTLLNCRPSVQDLWNLDILGVRDPVEVAKEAECDAAARIHFKENVTRRPDGRYVVKLPWLLERPSLVQSNQAARQRLVTMTSRLEKTGRFNDYNDVLQQWHDDDLIEESFSKDFHLLPHHPVFKPTSVTTPVRPVFNASFKIPGQPSLNDCLHKGPNLLELIPDMINRFRMRKVGVIADIKKAFQTIEVAEMDRDLQSFVWWTGGTPREMKVMRHKRVVFGVSSSPFLLAAVLEHHFDNVGEGDKAVASRLKSSFYVDNLVDSLDNLDQYVSFKNDAVRILRDAQMELTQWEHTMDQSDERCTKVLGLIWDKYRDELGVDFDGVDLPEKLTKRYVLSLLHRIFDPLGILSPATLPMKLLLQATWKEKLGWDETIPEKSQADVMSWLKEMKTLVSVRIPRHMGQGERVELHVFTDASKHAYAAAVFVRMVSSLQPTSIQLLQSKSRVSPLKSVTIPRLELLGCMLGARLASKVRSSLHMSPAQCIYWSDSTTAITWINRQNNWNVFVMNRVKEIRQLSTNLWRYVPSEKNLADLPSRGCSPQKLLETRWWSGADWLLNEKDWPMENYDVDESHVMAEKAAECNTININAKLSCWFAPRFNKFSSNIRVMAYIKRFISSCRKIKVTGKLTVSEITNAELILIKLIQDETLDTNSLKRLNVKVVVHNNIMKIETKLNERDDVSFHQPVLLPSKHPLVDQLIREIHLTSAHAGVQVIVNRMREKYWLLKARKTIRRVVAQCPRCRRFSSKPACVSTPPLPDYRTRPGDAFETTGVDLAGPLILATGEKAWVVLFTCSVYRAIHLDLVNTLSAADLLMCLQRFMCFHGRPRTMCSDRGTNFVAAKTLLDRLKVDLNEIREPNIRWVLNPPSAPWWGGWWERLIKSVKEQLKRILGKARLNYDELRTSLAVVMATVNDRPLTAVTQDDEDLIPLKPSMFLYPLHTTHHTDTHSLPIVHRKMRSILGSLRGRFRKEYLALLVQRKQERPTTISKGDLVFVGLDNKKRVEWPLGRIVELIPGKDKECRIAKVKVANGIILRPIQRLYPLELNENLQNKSNNEVDDMPQRTRSGRIVKKPVIFNA